MIGSFLNILIQNVGILSSTCPEEQEVLAEGYVSAAVRSPRRQEAAVPLDALHQPMVASGPAGLQRGWEGGLSDTGTGRGNT